MGRALEDMSMEIHQSHLVFGIFSYTNIREGLRGVLLKKYKGQKFFHKILLSIGFHRKNTRQL